MTTATRKQPAALILTSYSVGCTAPNGRETGGEFADFDAALRFFRSAVSSGNYASVMFVEWLGDTDCEELDFWMA